MRTFSFLFSFLIFVTLSAQDAQSYQMYHNVLITPKKGKVADFSTAYAAHNKKYHAEGPHRVQAFTVNTGINMGKIVNSTGPLTWADVDTRPINKEHDDDWANNVVPLIEDIEDGGHWRLNSDVSYLAENASHTKFRVIVIDVEQGEGRSHTHQMKNITEAHKAHFPTQSRLMLNRVGFRNDGMDRVIFLGLNNWADMDNGIGQVYEDVHGKGSWDIFIEEINEATVSSYQELWEHSPEMSGPSGN